MSTQMPHRALTCQVSLMKPRVKNGPFEPHFINRVLHFLLSGIWCRDGSHPWPSAGDEHEHSHEHSQSAVQGATRDLAAVIIFVSMCVPTWSKFSVGQGCSSSELLAGGRHTWRTKSQEKEPWMCPSWDNSFLGAGNPLCLMTQSVGLLLWSHILTRLSCCAAVCSCLAFFSKHQPQSHPYFQMT